MTNKQLIEKLETINKMEVIGKYQLLNQDSNLIMQVIDIFINNIDDQEDDQDETFDIDTIDSYIREVINQVTEHMMYSDLTVWLHYDNKHIDLVDDYVRQYADDIKAVDFNLKYILDDTLTHVLKEDLLTIINNQ